MIFQNYEIFIQLALAVLLGLVVGFERELAHKTAGMRTFSLVSLGSCLFSIISQSIVLPNVDPTRIAAQIVVGIGFLGAGSIIFREKHVQGLTTAAGLWAAAAIGMAVGFKLYEVSVFATLLMLLILTLFWRFERRIIHKEPIEETRDLYHNNKSN